MTTNGSYPRIIRAKELDVLDWVLPVDRPGYKRYRDLIAEMVVLSEGRRGPGNIILGYRDDVPDVASPLAPVVAYGMIEAVADTYSVTVREFIGKQIDAEIVSSRGEEIPDALDEKRRWTYSTWRPGEHSPATGNPVREVVIETVVLAIARLEKRVWVHDRPTGMNHLIPITNFYNHLMLHKHIRDAEIALKADLLFEHLDRYTDEDLRWAFVAYNAVKHKVDIPVPAAMEEKRGMKEYFRKLFSRGH